MRWPLRALVAGTVALSFKFLLAHTPVEGLRWLLGPTSWLTGLVTGHRFVWEAGVGYLSTAARFSIVSACAGVTFFSVALGLLLFHALERPWRAPLALAQAFVATVLANSMRLVGCVWSHVCHWRVGNLSGGRAAPAHRPHRLHLGARGVGAAGGGSLPLGGGGGARLVPHRDVGAPAASGRVGAGLWRARPVDVGRRAGRRRARVAGSPRARDRGSKRTGFTSGARG